MKEYSGKSKNPAISSREETYEVISEIKHKKRSTHGICQFFLVIFINISMHYVYILEGKQLIMLVVFNYCSLLYCIY